MDEQLLNEYINNLASQVNTLTQENILLKTRLSLLERREQERLKSEEKEEVKTNPAPESTYSTPPANPHSDYTTAPITEEPEEKVEEKKPNIPPLVKAPKPKGWNRKVDGPRPLIPNPKLAKKE